MKILLKVYNLTVKIILDIFLTFFFFTQQFNYPSTFNFLSDSRLLIDEISRIPIRVARTRGTRADKKGITAAVVGFLARPPGYVDRIPGRFEGASEFS